MKRTLSALLCAALLLTLAACGSFGNAVVRAAKELARVESLRADMELEVTMTIDVGGSVSDYVMRVSMGTDAEMEPLLARGEMTMDYLGLTRTTEYYMAAADEGYTGYFSTDGGKSWTAETGLTSGDVAQYDAGTGAAFYLDCASAFEKSGTETVNGEPAIRYDGVIPPERMEEAARLSGAWEQLETMPDGGTEMPEVSAMPLSVWLYEESGLPARYSLDLTELMNAFMQQIYAGGEASVTVSRAVVTTTLSGYNAVGELAIPEEVRNAA